MLKDDIENIVASACDGTWNGLEGAYFPEYNNPPQKLADKLVAYIERLLTQRAADECPTCAGLGFVMIKGVGVVLIVPIAMDRAFASNANR